MTPIDKSLSGKVAVVAGATRGAGRGIARMLGEAGAFVYCTGRSVRGYPATAGRKETIDETAEMIVAAGGQALALRVDHGKLEEVEALFERVKTDHGRLDVLVNDIWGGDDWSEWKPFWQQETRKGFRILDSAVRTHILTSRYGAPLMVAQRSGLIVEITDGDNTGYRGALFYDLAKMAAIRLAYDMAIDLKDTGVTAIAVTPGFLRSEAVLEKFGVGEENWTDAAASVRGFEESETPCFIGRAIAALATDPAIRLKSGKAFATWTLAREYGFTDIDGRKPDWGSYLIRSVRAILDRGGPDDQEERFWIEAWHMQWQHEPRYQTLVSRMSEALARTAARR
jgi:NAD(P)-dependent dehydrogenase (short-subunit alcohol dehydrogenase family)